jgi:sec-independent protein translocase protein TatB
MFDIGWSELMVLGVIALIVVGPKELPALLRTIGRYAGILKRQAAEFRGHFDQAMREAELDQLKKDLTGFQNEMESAARGVSDAAQSEVADMRRAVDEAVAGTGSSQQISPAVAGSAVHGDDAAASIAAPAANGGGDGATTKSGAPQP